MNQENWKITFNRTPISIKTIKTIPFTVNTEMLGQVDVFKYIKQITGKRQAVLLGYPYKCCKHRQIKKWCKSRGLTYKKHLRNNINITVKNYEDKDFYNFFNFWRNQCHQ